MAQIRMPSAGLKPAALATNLVVAGGLLALAVAVAIASGPAWWLACLTGLAGLVPLATVLLLLGRLRALNTANAGLREALKAAEEGRREDQAMSRLTSTIFEHSPVPISIMDADGKFAAVNPAFTKARGYTLEDVRGRTPEMLFGGGRTGAARDAILGALDREGEWTGEYLSRHKDGAETPAWASISLVRDEAGRIVNRVTVSVDIGERRAAEAQMRLLAKAFEVAAGPIFIADAANKIVAVNAAFTRATGYGAEEAIGKSFGLLHDEGAAAVLPQLVASLDRSGHWEGEITRRRADGSSFPTWSSTARGVDDAGNLLFTVVSFIDLTERAAAEAQLRLYASVFDHSGEAIFITDHHGLIIAANPTFTSLTGYSLADVRGKAPAVLSPHAEPTRVQEEMLLAIRDQGYWQGESEVRRKDGSVFPNWLVITSVRDERGAVTHRICSFNDVSERKASEEHIRQLAHHDALTGLPNRLNLMGRLEQALNDTKRQGDRVAVMFIDMDRFKLINDTLGHAAGDRLLCEVGRRLLAGVRESDIVARLGGDEFVVVLTGIHSAENTARQAEKILDSLAMPYAIDGHELNSTPSIGVSIFPDDGTTASELMRNADTAMYQAKAGGRNGFRFFTSSMNDDANERLMLEHSMRQALGRGEFRLHYQPQIDGTTRRVVGFEALIRWPHPTHGMISPVRFIPVAEETGLIGALGDWVLREALRELRAWRDKGHRRVRMAINISASQLRTPGFPSIVAAALADSGLEPGDLELEITESVAMHHPEETIRVLTALRDMGVELAIDDFGTGYSSLSYLKLLPIRRLKLDQSFVRDLEEDSNDAAICTATIALAHSLGLEVVAEGVETEGQYAFLARLNTDILQGYLFGRPVPAEIAVGLIDAPPCAKLAS